MNYLFLQQYLPYKLKHLKCICSNHFFLIYAQIVLLVFHLIYADMFPHTFVLLICTLFLHFIVTQNVLQLSR